jgi:hypothetical protein
VIRQQFNPNGVTVRIKNFVRPSIFSMFRNFQSQTTTWKNRLLLGRKSPALRTAVSLCLDNQ